MFTVIIIYAVCIALISLYLAYLYYVPKCNRIQEFIKKHITLTYVFEVLLFSVAFSSMGLLVYLISRLTIDSKGLNEIILSLTSLIVFNTVAPRLISLMSRALAYLEIKRYRSYKISPYKNLFEWLEKDLNEKALYKMFGGVKVAEQDIRNLRNVKNVILSKVGEEIGDYHLLKGYLESIINNDLLTKSVKIIGTIVTSFIAGILSKTILSNKSNELSYLLSVISNYNTFELIVFIIKALTVAIAVISLIVFIANELTKSKRRMNTVLGVINSIIEEKK